VQVGVTRKTRALAGRKIARAFTSIKMVRKYEQWYSIGPPRILVLVPKRVLVADVFES